MAPARRASRLNVLEALHYESATSPGPCSGLPADLKDGDLRAGCCGSPTISPGRSRARAGGCALRRLRGRRRPGRRARLPGPAPELGGDCSRTARRARRRGGRRRPRSAGSRERDRPRRRLHPRYAPRPLNVERPTIPEREGRARAPCTSACATLVPPTAARLAARAGGGCPSTTRFVAEQAALARLDREGSPADANPVVTVNELRRIARRGAPRSPRAAGVPRFDEPLPHFIARSPFFRARDFQLGGTGDASAEAGRRASSVLDDAPSPRQLPGNRRCDSFERDEAAETSALLPVTGTSRRRYTSTAVCRSFPGPELLERLALAARRPVPSRRRQRGPRTYQLREGAGRKR